ncbi:MAG: hypothetical protein ACI4QA_06335 [Candidatus Spyradosoma sp.]
MSERFQKKYFPWRNVVAALVTVALISATLAGLFALGRAREKASAETARRTLLENAILRRYGMYGDFPDAPDDGGALAREKFLRRFDDAYGALYGNAGATSVLANSPLFFGDGDVVGLHSGGRLRDPEGAAEKGADDRRWFDAKLALNGSESPFRLYGAGLVGVAPRRFPAEGTDASLREDLSLGGGFGFSWRFGDNAELYFDYRHSRPLDPASAYERSNAAGISLHLQF